MRACRPAGAEKWRDPLRIKTGMRIVPKGQVQSLGAPDSDPPPGTRVRPHSERAEIGEERRDLRGRGRPWNGATARLISNHETEG
jgi:hypothetical protein